MSFGGNVLLRLAFLMSYGCFYYEIGVEDQNRGPIYQDTAFASGASLGSFSDVAECLRISVH